MYSSDVIPKSSSKEPEDEIMLSRPYFAIRSDVTTIAPSYVRSFVAGKTYLLKCTESGLICQKYDASFEAKPAKPDILQS